jgi:hypothetical protein
MLTEYLVPYFASNVIGVAILLAAFKAPRLARVLLAALFAWAAFTNTRIALSNPAVYLEYGGLTWSGVYRAFIDGWFSRHIQAFVLTIALGQALIALLLTGGRELRLYGVAGAVTFLAAIAPLGVGSAFPFSLSVSAALLVMHRRLRQSPAAIESARHVRPAV